MTTKQNKATTTKLPKGYLFEKCLEVVVFFTSSVPTLLRFQTNVARGWECQFTTCVQLGNIMHNI